MANWSTWSTWSTPTAKTEPLELWQLIVGGVGLSLLVTLVNYYGSPLLVAIVTVAPLLGLLLLLRPEIGVLLLLTTILFKYPEFLEGSGWLTINNLLGIALSLILVATIVVRKQLWFLKVNQVQLFLLIGAVFFVNWLFLGRIEAPGDLSDFDLTNRLRIQLTNRFALLVFFVAFIRTPRQLLLVVALLLFSIFVTIPGAISHSLVASDTALGVDQMRAVATFGIQAAANSNRLAFICLMGISLILFAIQEYRGTMLRFIGGAAVLALILTVFLSGSRSGILNLLLLPFVLLSQGAMRRRQVAAVMLFFVLAFSVSLTFVPEAILQRLGTFLPTENTTAVAKSVVGSTEDRLMILRVGLNLFWENPVMGVGVGNFRWRSALDPDSHGIPMPVHNSYLLVLAEGGIILLGAYLLLFWQTFRDLGKALSLSALAPEVHLRWLILATRTNLILLLIFSFFADTWKEFYYFLILGTTAVLYKIYQQKTAERQGWMQPRSST